MFSPVFGFIVKIFTVSLFIILYFKPGFHITIMVQVVESQAGYDYGACVLSQVPQAEFNLVCGTAGTVQSEKSNLMNLS